MNENLRRVAKLESTLLPRTYDTFARYRNDPVKYVREVLGVRHLTSDQCAVLRAAAKERCRILVPSGNETGKSFIASCILSWHYDCFRPSISFITAPSAAQVHDIVFRELRMLRKGDPGFTPKSDLLTDGPDHIVKGYTAKDATSFHGRHDASVLLVFDEAEGIDPQFWEAAESFAHRWICFYNPTQANSAAAVAERSGKWEIVRMNAMNHPNIKAGEAGLPPVIPNAVTIDRLIMRVEKWCTPVRPGDPEDDGDIVLCGKRYRPGPVAQSRILGQRPTKPVNAVYSDEHLESMKSSVELKPHWDVQIGCDVARYGDDFTSIHVRQGRCSTKHESHNGWNTAQIAARLRHLCDEIGRERGVDPREIPVVIDDTGVGGGVVDQCRDYRFIGVNASIKADEPDEYPNNRSQIAFDFQDLLREKLVDMSRIPDSQLHDIIEQLRAMSYELDNRGRRMVHPKKVIKTLLNRSPDDADAVLLSYYRFPDTLEIHR